MTSPAPLLNSKHTGRGAAADDGGGFGQEAPGTVAGNGSVSEMRKICIGTFMGCCAGTEVCGGQVTAEATVRRAGRGRAGWSGEGRAGVGGCEGPLPARLVPSVRACEAASAGGAEKSAKDPDPEYVVVRSFPSAAFARPGRVLVTSLFPEKLIGQQQTHLVLRYLLPEQLTGQLMAGD